MLRQLEVQDRADGRLQGAHVGVLDVTAVLTQVAGDAVGAGALGGFGRPHRVGLVGAARLAQRRHVVNVDVEAHAFLPSEHSALHRNVSVTPRLEPFRHGASNTLRTAPAPRRDAAAGWAWAHTGGTARDVLLALSSLACRRG